MCCNLQVIDLGDCGATQCGENQGPKSVLVYESTKNEGPEPKSVLVYKIQIHRNLRPTTDAKYYKTLNWAMNGGKASLF